MEDQGTNPGGSIWSMYVAKRLSNATQYSSIDEKNHPLLKVKGHLRRAKI
jgi:hypothetical protein